MQAIIVPITRFQRQKPEYKTEFFFETDLKKHYMLLITHLQDSVSDKNPWPRLILWLATGYLIWQYLTIPNYYTPFDSADFAIHEVGHVVFSIFGYTFSILGGTLLQLLIPTYTILNFYYFRDYFAVTIAQIWLAINLLDISKYISDARAMTIPLVPLLSPHPIHDWNYLLSKYGLLNSDLLIGTVIRILGIFILTTSFLCGGLLIFWMIKKSATIEI